MAKDSRNVGEKLWSEGEVVRKEGNAVLDIKTADVSKFDVTLIT